MKNRNIFQQRWFVRSNNNYKTISTGGDKSNALSHVEFISSERQYHQRDNWSRKKEMDRSRILTYSRVNSTFSSWTFRQLILFTIKKRLHKKKHLTINSTQPNFVKKTSNMHYINIYIYKVGNKYKNKLKSAKRLRNNHRQCSTDKS